MSWQMHFEREFVHHGNAGHIYRLKKIDKIQEILIAKRNLVQNITEELILLASLIIVYVLLRLD